MQNDNIVVKLPNGALAVKAIYSKQDNPEYAENPFIEALPPANYDALSIIDKISYYPMYSEEERELDFNYRMNCVSRLFQYFQPLDKHLLIENTFSQMLRLGYVCRNPIDTKHVEALQKGYLSVKTGQKFEYNLEKFNSVHGFSIIGVSGIGKTTAIEKILTLYPQIIIHSDYKDSLPSVYQVVYLKIDCPFDGSIKAVCYAFFREMDNLLGTDYSNLYGRNKYSTDNMMLHMAQIARLHGLGCIILDEIQHLSLSRGSGGAEKLLNFLVTLTNSLKIPVVLIGTMKAMGVLQQDFRQARRGAGQGNIIWERMAKDNMWDLLIEGMWKYQWTKKNNVLTQEIKDTLYDESQGIVDIAIKLYAMSQYKAISSGSETITSTLIRDVAKDSLTLIQPMIKALRSNNISEIARFEDIRPFDITPFFNQQMQEARFQQAIITSKKAEKEKRSKDLEDTVQQSVLKLIDLGINAKKSKSLVKKSLSVLGDNALVNDIVKTSILISMETNAKWKSNNKDNFDSDDLRAILCSDDIDCAYEKLKENGCIKNIVYSGTEVKIC